MATQHYRFNLYINSRHPGASQVRARLRETLDVQMRGHYELKIIDLVRRPEEAEVRQVLAVPTLERERPLPSRRVIGDLSNTEQVLAALEVLYVGRVR